MGLARIPGSLGLLLAGIALGCPGSHADPTTQVRGQMSSKPNIEHRSEPLQSPPPHAARATAAAGNQIGSHMPQSPHLHATTAAPDLTLSHQRGRPHTASAAMRPSATITVSAVICRSLTACGTWRESATFIATCGRLTSWLATTTSSKWPTSDWHD